MASVNKVILLGNLGRDPEMRHLPNGDAVANISIATSETWKDKNGERQEKTQWHRLTMFRGLAEIVEKYLKKGSQIYVEGRIEYREYEKDGVTRYSTDIIVDEMKMLGGPRDSADTGSGDDGGERSRPAQKQQSAPAKKKADDFDDDIPF